jgi:hypothetical protein
MNTVIHLRQSVILLSERRYFADIPRRITANARRPDEYRRNLMMKVEYKGYRVGNLADEREVSRLVS